MAHWVNLPRLPDDPWVQDIDGWRLTISGRPDLRETSEQIQDRSSIAITHAMELRRADGATFAPEQLKPVLLGMQFGASFAAGRWVAPILPVGLDSDRALIWEEWRSSFCTTGSWAHTGDWLNFGRRNDLTRLFETSVLSFADVWEREHVWIPLIAIAVQSNMRDLRLEQRIMSLQAGLEMLAYVILRNDHGMSGSAYKSLGGAAARLRAILDIAKIPTSIDAAHLPRLEAYRLDEIANPSDSDPGPVDGPTVITRLRNKIIHPKPNSTQSPDQEARVQRQRDAMVESYALSHEYLLLLLMHRLGYRGEYRPPVWDAPQRPVPW